MDHISLAEKFFTERELKVPYKVSEGSAKSNAEAWFDAVERTVRDLPKYDHTNMGMPRGTRTSDSNHCPKDTEAEAWFFRGQKDAGYAFHSTLYRRLLDSSKNGFIPKTPKDYEESMVVAEVSLLEAAKKNGIGRGLSALETLTLLQHHGSPTRLLDVTSDWKVALFFACENMDGKDGRVFLTNVPTTRWQRFPKAKGQGSESDHLVWQDYGKIFPPGEGVVENYSWLSGVWPVLLPFSDPRMIAQRGFFLIGGVPSLKGAGYLNTSKCERCNEKVCLCGADEYGSKRFYLNTAELRAVTSLSIKFEADIKILPDVKKVKFGKWTAVGHSIRVPGEFKPYLREILRDHGVYEDSIYPPLRETSRLFDFIASNSFSNTA